MPVPGRLLCRTIVALGCAAALLANSRHAAAALRGEAYLGQPFGVAEINFSADRSPTLAGVDPTATLAEAQGRLLYPVLRDRPVRRVLRQLLDLPAPSATTTLVLFRGDGPLEITGPDGQRVTLTPRQNPRAHQRLLDAWWDQLVQRWQTSLEDPEFPPIVENYLTAQFAQRLGRPLPEPRRRLLSGGDDRADLLGELFLAERAKLEADRALFAEGAGAGEAVALPDPLPWFDVEPPADEQPIETEPIAARTPAECFYVRFGNLPNYLWFRDLTRKWHGDLQNMILRRALNRRAAQRVERQLSLRESALAKVLGPQVIADVALIGLDPYLADGAAVGILFQARNDLLLGTDLMSQRREALQQYADATESTVTIADVKVSLIATPDHRVRSFYVRDDGFHLVTTSEHLVRRFLQTKQGLRTLADSPGFRHARLRFPAERADAAFVYVSPEFMRNLTSPASWIGAQRRLRAVRSRALVALAQRQASAEGWVADGATAEIAQLLEQGLISPAIAGLAAPTDPTSIPAVGLPLADGSVTTCSPAEHARYVRFARRFREAVGQTPPLAIAAQRFPRGEAGGETARIEASATPLEGFRWGKAIDLLGEPSDTRIALLPEDVVRVEAVVEALLPVLQVDAAPHHVFAGLQPGAAQTQFVDGQLDVQGLLQSLQGYVGAWPRPGVLALLEASLPAEEGGPLDGVRGLWGRRSGDFMALSFKSEVVEGVLPQLAAAPAERPAQVRVDVRPLAGTSLEPLVNALGYQRNKQASQSAARLFNGLHSQLHVPLADCPDLAASLVDGDFVCPLGGAYETAETQGGRRVWNSTAYPVEEPRLLAEAPADYRLPLLQWFEGLRAEALLSDVAAEARLEIDLAKSATP